MGKVVSNSELLYFYLLNLDKMATYDWSKFICKINIKSTPAKIYEAWATRTGLESWFLRKAAFASANGEPVEMEAYLKKDDQYEWFWYGYPDEVVERGTVLAANGKDLFQFTFGEPCIVTINLKEEKGENIIELIQSQIPLDEDSKAKLHIGCLSGWTFYLANLKSILEGGVDLRNKNETLSGMANS